MKKNFMNPEIKIESFDLGEDIVTTSYVLTAAEQNVYSIMGVEVKDTAPETGYVYSINTESVK